MVFIRVLRAARRCDCATTLRDWCKEVVSGCLVLVSAGDVGRQNECERGFGRADGLIGGWSLFLPSLLVKEAEGEYDEGKRCRGSRSRFMLRIGFGDQILHASNST